MLDSLDDIVLRKGVCELGSGVGVTGAVVTEYIRLRGVGDIVLTDGMDDVLELLTTNISNTFKHDTKVKITKNMWMEGSRSRRYGVVFGSDLVYERRGVEMVKMLAMEVKRILEVTTVGVDGKEVGGGAPELGEEEEEGGGDEFDVTRYAYDYEANPMHKPFILFVTRRSYPLPMLVAEMRDAGLTYKGLAEGGQRDIFDNDIDGLSELWRDAVLVFLNEG